MIKEGVLIPITVIFYAEMMPVFELIIQPTITFHICTFSENLCSKKSHFHFFKSSIIEITTWEGLYKCDVCVIILASDYKKNVTTVNSLWKSFLFNLLSSAEYKNKGWFDLNGNLSAIDFPSIKLIYVSQLSHKMLLNAPHCAGWLFSNISAIFKL